MSVAEVFRAHGETYRQGHALSFDQRKVMRDIEQCRTAALGGHLYVCPDSDCDYQKPVYNSCRNRHCPTCQSLSQAQWIEQRMQRILPVHYFHVVFTLPSELRSLVRAHRQPLFDLLFASASKTLLDLGDDTDRLGGRLGITAVLHTWTRELLFHPHLHCIVTGGGLAPSADAWKSLSPSYLFPAKVLGALFRGKFLAGLRQLHDRGQLSLLDGSANQSADSNSFDALLNQLYNINWNVYAKKTFGGPEQVFRYLGRYTHRVAISNQRIQAIGHRDVRFATKNGDSCTLTHECFLSRFLDHVLPKGFVKIRHFGIHASVNVTTKLVKARAVLAETGHHLRSDLLSEPSTENLPWYERLHQLTGIDPTLCPRCSKRLLRRPLPEPQVPSTSPRCARGAPTPWDTS